jgi:hypothetical protein
VIFVILFECTKQLIGQAQVTSHCVLLSYCTILHTTVGPLPIDRLYLSIFTPFTFLQGMYIQGILNKEEYGYEEADAWLEQLLYKDGGTAYLKLMKGFEQTDEKE